MKIVIAIGIVTVLAACGSAPRYSADSDVRQKLTVECTASNVLRSGCKTEHEIALVTTLTPDNRPMPSVEDLRAQAPAPETY